MKTRRIVVGVDGSEGSREALEWCVGLARDLDAEIIAVHSVEIPMYAMSPAGIPLMVYDSAASRHRIKEAFERDWCAPLQAAHVKYQTEMVEGQASSALMSIAEGEHADMIVVGARGRGGFTELVLGSVSHQVTHHARCPVVVVPMKQDQR